MIVSVPTPTPVQLSDLVRPFDFKTSVFVLLTDTVYGIHAAYANHVGRERISQLKNRANAAFIVLVNGLAMARELCTIDETQEKILRAHWPGSISFILPLRRGTGTLALRHAKSLLIDRVLEESGALFSTSANRHGDPPAMTATEAQKIFGTDVDFYLDSGRSANTVPSTLVDLSAVVPKVLREGAVAFHLPTSDAQP